MSRVSIYWSFHCFIVHIYIAVPLFQCLYVVGSFVASFMKFNIHKHTKTCEVLHLWSPPHLCCLSKLCTMPLLFLYLSWPLLLSFLKAVSKTLNMRYGTCFIATIGVWSMELQVDVFFSYLDSYLYLWPQGVIKWVCWPMHTHRNPRAICNHQADRTLCEACIWSDDLQG